MSEEKQCSTCVFVADMGVNKDLTHNYMCRRYPPSLSHLPTPTGQIMNFASWPSIPGDGWCGEYAIMQAPKAPTRQ